MLELGCPDLATDPASVRVAKSEVVAVEFAINAGKLESAVGENRYATGDALIAGSTGDRWSVSREPIRRKVSTLRRYDWRAERAVPQCACAGHRQAHPRTVQNCAQPGGDVLTGRAGDWAVQYAPGDYGIVDAGRFERVYRPVQSTGSGR